MRLIDKQKALDALMAERKYLIARGQESAEHVLTHHAYNVIDEQPIIESRPKGKWIADSSCNGFKKGDVLKIDKYGFGAFNAVCSVCGKWLVGSDEYACYANFCPYCGADMRGG